jgi:hypothetical protein
MVAAPPAASTPLLTLSATKRRVRLITMTIDELTLGDMAIHGVDLEGFR